MAADRSASGQRNIVYKVLTVKDVGLYFAPISVEQEARQQTTDQIQLGACFVVIGCMVPVK